MHEGHRKRKRKQALLADFQNFEVHEILEFLLYHSIPRIDTNPIAHRLIDRFGSISGVFDADYSELMSVEGVGESTAFLLKLMPEVIKQYELSKKKSRINVGTRKELMDYVKSLFVSSRVEQFYCICVSAGKNVISTRLMNSGLVDGVDVEINDIVKEALDKKVSGIVIAHNHPYGNAQFSAEDSIFTGRLMQALLFFNIKLIDHFLVAKDECVSFMEVCT